MGPSGDEEKKAERVFALELIAKKILGLHC